MFTFREKTRVSIRKMSSKEPAIAKLVVSFNQLDSIAFGET